MVLETGRLAIQVDDYRPIPPDVDIGLVVADRNSRVDAALAVNPDQFTEVWRNPRFVIYRPVTKGV